MIPTGSGGCVLSIGIIGIVIVVVYDIEIVI